jgi:hypothetical protein
MVPRSSISRGQEIRSSKRPKSRNPDVLEVTELPQRVISLMRRSLVGHIRNFFSDYLQNDKKLWGSVFVLGIFCISLIIYNGDPEVVAPEPEVELEFHEAAYEELDIKVATESTSFFSQVGATVATLDSPYLVIQNTYNDVIWSDKLTGIDYVVGLDYDPTLQYIILYGSYKEDHGVVWVYTNDGVKHAYVTDTTGVITSAAIHEDLLIYGTDSSFEPNNNSHLVFMNISTETVIYDSQDDFDIQTTEIDGQGGWSSIDISTNGVYAAAAYWDLEGDHKSQTALYELSTQTPYLCWDPYPLHGSISEIVLSSDGMNMAAGTAEGTVMFWHQAPYQISPQWFAQFAEGSEISDIDLSADGSKLVAAGGQSDNESIGYWGYWETEYEEEELFEEDPYHPPTWSKRVETGKITSVELYEDENVFYTRNADNNLLGYYIPDESVFYDDTWRYIRQSEWNEWKETHLEDAETAADNSNEGESVWKQPETYYPIILTAAILFCGYLVGQRTRRWTEE